MDPHNFRPGNPGRTGQVAIGRYNSKQAPRKPEEDLEEDPMPMPEEDLSRWLLGETDFFWFCGISLNMYVITCYNQVLQSDP